jgi:hypothetical protein
MRFPSTHAVTPAKTGVQNRWKNLDSGLRRNDEAKASSKAKILDKSHAP